MKKTLALFLAMLMLLSSFSFAMAEEATNSIFPLAEPMTFTINVMTPNDVDILESIPFYQELVEKTNVHLEFVNLGADVDSAKQVLNNYFNSNSYADAVWGGSLILETDYAALVESGILIPLTKYVNDAAIMRNFQKNVLSESPKTLGAITALDGEIYALPRFNNNAGAYLESPICVNKLWLDALNLEVPTTIDEFHDMLVAFKTQDPNGNGEADEIPIIFREGDARRHMEVWLGLWGIGTKNNANDNYIYIEDGVVKFAPTSEAYKQAIITLNKWYEEGLIWSESFVANNESFSAKVKEASTYVGIITDQGGAGNPNNSAMKDFVQIAPPSVEGYETSWFFHPGFLAVKGKFSVTSKCENPEILMAYMDLFYDYENYLKFDLGMPEDGRYTIDENGVTMAVLSAEEQTKLSEEKPTMGMLVTDIQRAQSNYYYTEFLAVQDVYNTIMSDAYAMYNAAGVLNDEIWPRPTMSVEDADELNYLRTDILSTANMKKAQWVTGAADIEAEWDEYVKLIESMGLADFLAILQKNYDRFINAQ